MLVKPAPCCFFFLFIFDNLVCGYSCVGDIESNWMDGLCFLLEFDLVIFV